MATNSKQTSSRVASTAGKTLGSSSSSTLQKSLAGSALRQTGSRAQTGVGIEARRRSDAPGVWVGPDKVAALGLHVRRGVTMHGFAINLSNDLRGFSLITPCGILDGGVTSVERCSGTSVTPAESWASVAASVLRAFEALDRDRTGG